MSENEIVRRLRDNRHKIVFEGINESSEIEDPEEEIQEDDEESAIPEEEIQEEDEESIRTCECGSKNIIKENDEEICDDCGRKITEPVKEDAPVDKKPAVLRKALSWWNAGYYQRAVELYKKYGVTDAEFARALVKSLHEGKRTKTPNLKESISVKGFTPSTLRYQGKPIVKLYVLRDKNIVVTIPYGDAYEISDTDLDWLKNKLMTKKFDMRDIKSVGQRVYLDEDAMILGDDSDEDKLGGNIIRALQTPMTTATKPNIAGTVTESEEEECETVRESAREDYFGVSNSYRIGRTNNFEKDMDFVNSRNPGVTAELVYKNKSTVYVRKIAANKWKTDDGNIMTDNDVVSVAFNGGKATINYMIKHTR